MKDFIKSLKIVNLYLIYIPVLALGGLMIWSESTRVYALLSALLSLILYPIICGRIIETIKQDSPSTWSDLLANYFVKYLGLALILIIPILFALYAYADMDYLTNKIAKVLTGIALQCIAVYAWPLVFLKRRVFNAIHEGFIFLIHNPMKNLPLILLIVLASTIKLLAMLSPVYIFHSVNLGLIYGIGYLHNVINVYLDLIIFSMATFYLLEDDGKISDLEPQERQQ